MNLEWLAPVLTPAPESESSHHRVGKEIRVVATTPRAVMRRGAVLTVLAVGGMTLAGCGSLSLPGSGSGSGGGVSVPSGEMEDGNENASLTSPAGKTRGEPNDSIEDAVVAVYVAGTARLQGTIADIDDIDVYDLGPMEPGDVIRVSATANASLDVSVALYDDELRYFAGNDDESLGSLDSFVEETVRHAGDPYYLVLTSSPFASSFERLAGGYRARVTVTREGDVPEPRAQTLFLNFDGATLNVPSIPVAEVPPFTAEEISPVYAGQTEIIKQGIVATVKENYAGLDVTIITSDETSAPEPPYSTAHFGGTSFVAFGISEQVDVYNGDAGDVSVIFTGSFQPELFSETPTAEEIAIAIGNVASHESGHLLGLNHVHDATAIMDEVNPADTFLQDQDFKEAPLSETIGPFGVQDAFLLLQEIVGLR